MAKGNKNIAEAGKSTRFSSTNQPENSGRKGKTVSEFLKEFGENKKIEFEIKLFKDDLEKPYKVKKGKVESESTINEVLAITLINKAISGDGKAMDTYLDRTEGKVSQNLNLGGQEDNPIQVEQITGMVVK